VSVRWLWRCGAELPSAVPADARCDPRGRLVAVAVATGGGATPAAASRHSDSLTALHPPHLARPFLVAAWLTDRQADHAPARPCHLRSASQHEGCRCHRRVGQGGGVRIYSPGAPPCAPQLTAPHRARERALPFVGSSSPLTPASPRVASDERRHEWHGGCDHLLIRSPAMPIC
jgi:hypothetical protein